MKIIKKTSISSLNKKYDLIVGWGNAPIELSKRFTADELRLRYIVNGENINIGKNICGAIIVPPEKFLSFEGKICFIIFSNVELRILPQINEMYPQADTIVSRLVDFEDRCFRKRSYSTDCEDYILLNLVKKLSLPKDFSYMDIGVCHPVVRNNTYALYEAGYINGTLVDPNPEMMGLAEEYRPENRRVIAGAGVEEGILPYVRKKNGGAAGKNHFLRDGEIVDESEYIVEKFPIYDINHIIDEYCSSVPEVLDIDAEGMDYAILEHIDFDKYPIKIICAERDKNEKIYNLMLNRGYIHYAETRENIILVRAEIAKGVGCLKFV